MRESHNERYDEGQKRCSDEMLVTHFERLATFQTETSSTSLVLPTPVAGGPHERFLNAYCLKHNLIPLITDVSCRCLSFVITRRLPKGPICLNVPALPH